MLLSVLPLWDQDIGVCVSCPMLKLRFPDPLGILSRDKIESILTYYKIQQPIVRL
jgi:hypothetical protein